MRWRRSRANRGIDTGKTKWYGSETHFCAAVQINHYSLFVISTDRLARTTSPLLGRSRVLLRATSCFLGWYRGLLVDVSGHRLARASPRLLRRRYLSFVDLLDFLFGRKRLARTASSLLRSNFDLIFFVVVSSRSSLLRASAAFLSRSGVFGVGSLLALLRRGLGCLLVVVFIGSLRLCRATTLLSSSFLWLVFFVASL